MIDLDALIIGGGAQGLWVLRDLNRRGYRAVLLERGQLGGKQTCHSHALIHRGHYYDDIDMMIVLNAAAQFWEAFIEEAELHHLNDERALAGFGRGTKVRLHEYMWRTAGLRFERAAQVPEILRGGRAYHLFETEEFSIDASEVVDALAADFEHCIYRVDDGPGGLVFERDATTVQRVTARIEGQETRWRRASSSSAPARTTSACWPTSGATPTRTGPTSSSRPGARARCWCCGGRTCRR